jgi:hypothetical protein
MRSIVKTLRLMFAMTAVAALGFGTVRGLDSGRADCPADPPTFPGASCSVASECETPCKDADPDAWWWDCDLPEGCCVCAIR